MPTCCNKSMRRDWSYCPMCGEEIDWPPTAEEMAARAAARERHEQRMQTDPKYAADQAMLAHMMESQVKSYTRQVDVLTNFGRIRETV